MQSNSNQPVNTVSIRSKRDKFRSEVRRDQLQAYFRTKRISFLVSESSLNNHEYFTRLQKRIKLAKGNFEELADIEKEIISLFDKDPQNQLNFSVLTHLLCELQNCHRFQSLIIKEENLIFHSTGHFAWCLGVYFISWYIEIEKNGLQANVIQEADKLDMFLAALIERFYNNENFRMCEQTIYCFEIYLEAFKNLLILMRDHEFFPNFCFYETMKKLHEVYKMIQNQKVIYVRTFKIKLTELFLEICTTIKKRELYIAEKEEHESQKPSHISNKNVIKSLDLQRFMKSAGEVFLENIVDTSDVKGECIRAILVLSQTSAITAGEQLFSETMIKELNFNMIHQKVDTSLKILQAFGYVLPAFNNKKWITIFSSCLHLNLITMLKDSLNEMRVSEYQESKYSESLYQILCLIEVILSRTRDMSPKDYARILMHMNNYGLGDLLDSMNHFRYSTEIETKWTAILDKHFSSDMDEEYNFGDENGGDYSNVRSNERENEKYQGNFRNTNNYSEDLEI